MGASSRRYRDKIGTNVRRIDGDVLKARQAGGDTEVRLSAVVTGWPAGSPAASANRPINSVSWSGSGAVRSAS